MREVDDFGHEVGRLARARDGGAEEDLVQIGDDLEGLAGHEQERNGDQKHSQLVLLPLLLEECHLK